LKSKRAQEPVDHQQNGINEPHITTFDQNFYIATNYIQETNIFLLNLAYIFNPAER
jgi:hypothetical protein